MKGFVPLTVLALVAGQALSTSYDKESALRVDATTTFELETTSMSVTRDGQPVEAGGSGGFSSETRRHVVVVDRVLETGEDGPTKVRRSFEDIEGKSSLTFGEESREMEAEPPLDGVTLEITVGEKGEPKVDVVEGDSPSDPTILEGHVPTLALDALLPDGDVEAGSTWEPDGSALSRALSLDIESALFPPTEPEPGGGERGERGGGRRRGGARGIAELFRAVSWKGEAKLDTLDEDHDGVTCAVIMLRFEGSGELEEPEFGGSGGRRERMPESGADAGAVFGTSVEMQLEGRLLFALGERRPVSFEIEGSVTIERDSERTRGESTMHIRSTQEGHFKHAVELTKVE